MTIVKTGGGIFEVTATKTENGATVTAKGKWRGDDSGFSIEFRNAEPDSVAYLAKLESAYGATVEGFGFGEDRSSNFDRNSIIHGLNPRIWQNMDTKEVHGWSVYSRYYSNAWTDAKRKALYLLIESGLNSLDFLSPDALADTEKSLKRANAEMILREVERLRESAQINLEEAKIKEQKALLLLEEVNA